MGRPFAFRFNDGDRFYIYDVNTNAVMEVDEPLFSVIDRVSLVHGDSGARAVVDDADGLALSSEGLTRCLTTIESSYVAHGLFSDRHPATVAFPFTDEDCKLLYERALRHLVLNVTEDCNLRCDYCKYSGRYLYARTHNSAAMSSEVAHKAIRFLVERSSYIIDHTSDNLTVGFYGGEPLLNFPVVQSSVTYARSRYPHLRNRLGFAMTTNLTTGTADAISFLAEYDFNLLVSVDGPSLIHDRYRVSRGGRGTFDQVLRNLTLLRSANPGYYDRRVGFSVVLAPPYDLDAVVEFFAQEDLFRNGSLVVSFVDADYTTFLDRFRDRGALKSELATQLAALDKRLLDGIIGDPQSRVTFVLNTFVGKRLQNVVKRSCTQLPVTLFPNGICIPGFQKTFVGPDAQLYVCEKTGYGIRIGHLDSGYDAAGIKKVVNQYVALCQDRCLNCWAIRFCNMCFVSVMRGAEVDSRHKAIHCQSFRASAAAALKRYCRAMERDPGAVQKFYDQAQVFSATDLAFRFLRDYKVDAPTAG